MASAFLAGFGPGLMQGLNAGRRQQKDPIEEQIRLLQLQNLIRQQKVDEEAAGLFKAGIGAATSGGFGGSGSNPYAGLNDNLGQGGDGQFDMPRRPSGGGGFGAPGEYGAGQGNTGGLSLDASDRNIIQRESGGNWNVGAGGTDLSNAPLDKTGFPIWPGIPARRPQDRARGLREYSAGGFQITRDNWHDIAPQIGVTDFSPQSQLRVRQEMRRRYGDAPWAMSAPGGGSSTAPTPNADDAGGGGDADEGIIPAGSSGAVTIPPRGNQMQDVQAGRPVPSLQGTGQPVTRQRLQGGAGPRSDAGGLDQLVGQRAPMGGMQRASYGGQQAPTPDQDPAAYGATPQDLQQANQIVRRFGQLAQNMPQGTIGNMSEEGMMRWLNQQNGSYAAKAKARDMLNRYLAPQFQRNWEEYKAQREHQWQIDRWNYEHGVTQADLDRRRKEEGGEMGYDSATDTQIIYNKNDHSAVTAKGGKPYQMQGDFVPQGQHNRIGKPVKMEIPQEDGSIKKVQGQQLSNGQWVTADEKREPIDTSRGYSIITGEAGGRLAETQTRRITLGANQVALALNNLSKMPKGASLGIFGGLQQNPGQSLSDALKRTLTNELTPEADDMISVITRGVSRGLGTIEGAGAATGLQNLSAQMEANLPRKGDTPLIVATKLADTRQIVEGAMEVLIDDPRIPDGSKETYRKILERVRTAVPYTVEQAMAIRANPDEETIADFARSVGLAPPKEGGQTSAPQGAGVTGTPPPAAIRLLQQDPSPAARKEFDDAFGPGSAARALGQ